MHENKTYFHLQKVLKWCKKKKKKSTLPFYFCKQIPRNLVAKHSTNFLSPEPTAQEPRAGHRVGTQPSCSSGLGLLTLSEPSHLTGCGQSSSPCRTEGWAALGHNQEQLSAQEGHLRFPAGRSAFHHVRMLGQRSGQTPVSDLRTLCRAQLVRTGPL